MTIADGRQVWCAAGLVTLQITGLVPVGTFAAIITGGQHNLIGATLWRTLGITVILGPAGYCQMIAPGGDSLTALTLLRSGSLMDPHVYVRKCKPLRIGATLTLELLISSVPVPDEQSLILLASRHFFYTAASRDDGTNITLLMSAQVGGS